MKTFTAGIATGVQSQRCRFCSSYIPLEFHGFSHNLMPAFNPCCEDARKVFPAHTVVDVFEKDVKFFDDSLTLGSSWYHATSRDNWLDAVTADEDEWSVPLVHVGTEEAAADRMKLYRWSEKAYMYKVRFKDDTVLNADVFEDEDDWPETPDDLWDGSQAFRYVNGFESVGSVSLLVNPRQLVLEEVRVFEGPEVREYIDRMNPLRQSIYINQE